MAWARWWGKESEDNDRRTFFPARVLSVTDVVEIRDIMGGPERVKVFAVPETFIGGNTWAAYPEIVDLENASDYEIRRIGLATLVPETDEADTALCLGQAIPNFFWTTYSRGGDWEPEFKDRVLAKISESRRPIVTAAMVPDVLRVGAWLLLLVLFTWFARAVWPLIPAVILAAIVCLGAGWQVHRGVYKFRPERWSARAIVRPVIRTEARQQRRERRRIVFGGFVGFLLGIGSSLVVALVTGTWTP